MKDGEAWRAGSPPTDAIGRSMARAGFARRSVLGGAVAFGLAAALTARGVAERRVMAERPLVLGHRGACALRPEHTLASYAKASGDGADYVEPDLVISRDGALVIRHENNIAETTDVARHPAFAGRRTEKIIDGTRQVGWFAEDFTLAELKTLRAIERLPRIRPGNAAMDGRFGLVTWEEMVDFTAAQARESGRAIGLIPELKHSTYFASIGLPLEDRFLASLDRHAYLARAPLVIQSFETANLRHIHAKLDHRHPARLMQLIYDPAGRPADIAKAGGSLTYRRMMEPEGLAEIAAYADILSPSMRSLVPLRPDGTLDSPTAVIADAHHAGLLVMPYTFRPENLFLAADFLDGGPSEARNPAGSIAEIGAYLAAGIDGFFTDDPALGRTAVERLRDVARPT